MSAVKLDVIPVEEAHARYAALLEEVGDRAALERRAEAYALDASDSALYDDIVELEFLLGLDQ